MLNTWEITHERGDLSPEVWDYLREHRFFGMIIPEEYGGLGFSAYAHSQVVMKVSSRSMTAGVTVMVPNSLGPAELLLQYGTDEQKDHYLPRLADGREIPCFGLTGPFAGSDAASIPDVGVVCWGECNGERVLGLRANWRSATSRSARWRRCSASPSRPTTPTACSATSEELGITWLLMPEPSTPGRRDSATATIPWRPRSRTDPIAATTCSSRWTAIIGGQRAASASGWRMLME
ncbi:MAG: acyl-CoA dehydrogenase family protein [Halofilum sp. (in: g-proteobacteria)]|nr:acyl-CoA dehydrogenase family protein [Halofilum sp. (in: g-proteobacteria)]